MSEYKPHFSPHFYPKHTPNYDGGGAGEAAHNRRTVRLRTNPAGRVVLVVEVNFIVAFACAVVALITLGLCFYEAVFITEDMVRFWGAHRQAIWILMGIVFGTAATTYVIIDHFKKTVTNEQEEKEQKGKHGYKGELV